MTLPRSLFALLLAINTSLLTGCETAPAPEPTSASVASTKVAGTKAMSAQDILDTAQKEKRKLTEQEADEVIRKLSVCRPS